MSKRTWPMLIGFILISLLAGAIGSIFTISAIPAWYATLSKPSFSPPNWVFGPVWTILYILMGIAAYLVWIKGQEIKEKISGMGKAAREKISKAAKAKANLKGSKKSGMKAAKGILNVNFALKVFGFQLILNALWSILFFGLRSPLYGFLCIIPLWLSIAWTIKLFWQIDRRAAYLLVPYIAWVSFASVLNYFVFVMN